MIANKWFYLMVLGMVFGVGVRVRAQVQTDVPAVVSGAKPVSVERIKIHGKALEGNLEGDAVDRDVLVFLPPSYTKEKSRHYPVVYALHGYSIGAEQWSHEIHVPQTIEGAFAQGAKEMIVVLPDSKTLHNGSMYSSSVTTGNFERFIAHDVVAYVDAHYRTIPERASRGLVGHSMGGYGASRIGMKHSDVFGSLYIMSPCCMSARPARTQTWRRLWKPSSSPRNLPICLSSRGPRSPRQQPGRLTRRILRCILIFPQKTGNLSRISSRNGRPTRPSPLSINTSTPCASITAFRSM